ncbi:hypothetical protein [Paenibacillus xylanexedens]|uniref:hypothetical protein n=1 Tax=Paenibacillus xylanexedens TaxID=528191 RepID=UPI0028E8D8D1|nr:hypothetical protein [Paenibacillus xylanexedens]
MNAFVGELEEMTLQLISKLEHATYEELADFVERRQPIIDQLNQIALEQKLTPEEKERLKVLLQHDPIIMVRMTVLKNEAGDWLSQRKQATRQRSVYEVAYTPNSLLVDKRK